MFHWEIWPEGEPLKRIKGKGLIGYMIAYWITAYRCFDIRSPKRISTMKWKQ